MIRFPVADLQVSILDAGRLWLDGGAMFGVVPKPMWARERPCDDDNRIELAMNLLLIEDGRSRILIDTGAGTKGSEKFRAIHRLETRDAATMLAPAGLTPEDIDVVVVTHLHFDHAGGNTVRSPDGALSPAFPNARYVIQRGELETARRQDNERIRAAFLPENFEPLASEAGRVELVDGDTSYRSYLSLRLAPGHTPHMQIPVITTPERTVAFLADLVPTTSHLRYPWIMGFDVEPLATLASKKRFLPRAVREGWWVVFEHDADLPLAGLHEQHGRVRARAADAVCEEGR